MPSRSRAFRLLTGFALVIAAAPGFAMGMGEITVTSALGEPLQATIPVTLDEDILPQSQCFELAAESRVHPALSQARLSLVAKDSGHELRITTPVPIHDPVLDLTVKSSDCGVPLQRDYVVFLSPRRPEWLADVAVVATAAQPMPAPVRRAPAHTSVPLAVAPRKPPRATVRTAKKVASVVTRRSYQVFKLDYSLDSLARLGDRPARSRPSLAMGAEPGGTAKSGVVSAPGDAGTTRQQVVAAAPRSATTSPGSAPDRPPSGEQAPVLRLPSSHGDGRTVAASFWPVLAPYPLLVFGLLLLFTAAFALWWKWRGPASRSLGRHDSVFEPMPLTAPVTPATPPKPAQHTVADAQDTDEKPQSASPDGDLDTLPTPPRQQAAAPAPPPGDIEAEPFLPLAMPSLELEMVNNFGTASPETPEQVLELAEVMLAFGRSRQAIEALDTFIGSNPQMAVDPWLKLLELYQDVGQREQFDAVSRRLNKTFNIAIPSWDDFAAAGTQPGMDDQSLQAMPHILAHLVSVWDTEEALPYLERLLEDNRSGQRSGFSLPVVWDILLLRDILRARKA